MISAESQSRQNGGCNDVQNEIQRRWWRWRLRQRLQVEPRRQCSSMSQSGGGPTNVTLLIKAAATPESGLA